MAGAAWAVPAPATVNAATAASVSAAVRARVCVIMMIAHFLGSIGTLRRRPRGCKGRRARHPVQDSTDAPCSASQSSSTRTWFTCSSRAANTSVTRSCSRPASSSAVRGRVGVELLAVARRELVEALAMVVPLGSELGRGRDVLRPLVELGALLLHAPRPQPVDEHPIAVGCLGRLVHALHREPHGASLLPPRGPGNRTWCRATRRPGASARAARSATICCTAARPARLAPTVDCEGP